MLTYELKKITENITVFFYERYTIMYIYVYLLLQLPSSCHGPVEAVWLPSL